METIEPDVVTQVIKLDSYALTEILLADDEGILANSIRRRIIDAALFPTGHVAAFQNYT
jgi:hypothetical protein